MSRRRFASLDTDFLLALEAGDESYAGIVDWLTSVLGLHCLVTATVLQELADIEHLDKNPDHAKIARQAQMNITTWGFYSTPLAPVENGVAERIAEKLFEKGILDGESKNDGLVLAEAAFQGCQLFVTGRKTLLHAHLESLRLAMIECDVSDLLVASPDFITSYIEKSSKSPAGGPGEALPTEP